MRALAGLARTAMKQFTPHFMQYCFGRPGSRSRRKRNRWHPSQTTPVHLLTCLRVALLVLAAGDPITTICLFVKSHSVLFRMVAISIIKSHYKNRCILLCFPGSNDLYLDSCLHHYWFAVKGILNSCPYITTGSLLKAL